MSGERSDRSNVSAQPHFLYMVQMDIPDEHESEFNRVYDNVHVPAMTSVPGVLSGFRFKVVKTTHVNMARYIAVYELESSEVLDSKEWAAAAQVGEWAPTIRPLTFNRNATLFRKVN